MGKERPNQSSARDEGYMDRARILAQDAAAQDEVPVGAIILVDDVLAGEGFNRNIGQHDPTAHAEIEALRQACSYVENHRLVQGELFVTLEPCPMCFHALVQARIKRIVIGARDPKGGFSRFFSSDDLENMNHQPEIVWDVQEEACRELVVSFFRKKRERGKRKWLREN